MEIVNSEEENLHIFWTSWEISQFSSAFLGLKKLTNPSVQEDDTLSRCILNIATRNVEVEMGLKYSINLKKELMSLWNLSKVLRFPTNFSTMIGSQR